MVGKVGLQSFLFWSRQTWQGSDANDIHAALGLAGETGEVVDLVKKHYFTPARLEAKGVDFIAALSEELGDVLYYWVRLCDVYGLDPDEIIAANIAKLEKRYDK